MAQVGPKLVDGTSSSRSARRPSVLPLLGVDLRGRTLDSVEALLLLGVRAGIRLIIMSQISPGASVISTAYGLRHSKIVTFHSSPRLPRSAQGCILRV